MDIFQVLNQMMVLFILLAIGYIAGKAGVINQVTNERLTKVVLNVTQPALMLNAMTSVGDDISLREAAICLLASVLFFVISLLIAFLSTRLMKVKAENVGTFEYIMSFGNVGFMGFPVIKAIFGMEAVFYCSLLNLAFNFIVYSVGIVLMTKQSGRAKIDPKRFLNAPLISAAIAFLLFLIKFQMPEIVASALDMMGGATTPIAMLILGGALAMMPVKELFGGWRIYVVTFIKLLFIPFITWLVLGQFLPSDSTVLHVIVVLAGMPVATNAIMMAIEFGGNQRTVARGIFITTVLCVLTIPLITYVISNYALFFTVGSLFN